MPRRPSGIAHGAALCSNTRVAALTAPERALLLAIAPRIVPPAADLTPETREAMLALIDGTLASRTPAMRRQFRLFLRALRWLPALRYLRPLDRLDGSRQDAALRWFQDHPIQLLRGGFWGVRTLVLLGYYGQPAHHASIGYSPPSDGNAELHARARR
jgi:hypothetical protein